MRRPRTRWIVLGSCVALVFVVGAVNAGRTPARRSTGTRASDPPPSAAVVRKLLPPGTRPPLVLTYFFYWYDTQTQQHLRPQDGLATHLPASPAPSWRSEPWYRQQLLDMEAADIDVVLPVYWGTREPWSTGGLPVLVEARHKLLREGKKPPGIGMFYDTSIVRGLDLTKAKNIDVFYANVARFFRTIPQSDWARLDGRPIVWLFLPQDNKFDQAVFDAVYARFTDDFGVRPFIVRATGWDCATTVSRCRQPISTDASYVWGVAQDGMQYTHLVAAAGPGYDERQISGRSGKFVQRANGEYYRRNLSAAVATGRPLIAIETWNEIHEASGIGATVEYGRAYIDETRQIVGTARRGTR